MNPRKLIPLVVVLAVLVVLALMVTRKKSEDQLQLEAGLRRLAPEDFLLSDVGRLEIFLGSKEEQKIVLQREASGWRVQSHFNTRADDEKVSNLLEDLKALEGEFRVDEESVLEDFGLTGKTAIHLVLFKKESEQAWFRLLVGKSLPNGGFVRLGGENAIYVLDRDLRREFGLFTEEASKAPGQSHWINTTIMALNTEEVEKLTITWPDRKAVFEKRVKPEIETEETTEGTTPQKTAPSPDEVEWVTKDPPSPFPIKAKGVNEILNTLSRLTADDVVDPKEKEEKGLDEPPFRCTVTLTEGEENTLIASHPDPLDEGYMMVEGEDRTIFRVARYTFEGVFKKGGDLFELPALPIEKKAIQRLSLTWPDKTLVLQKTASGEFEASSGQPKERELIQNKVKTIWDSLPRISPADFVQLHPERDRGLKDPSHQATIMLDNGKHHVISLGDEARGVAGRYMRIDEDPQIFVMAKADFDRIFPPFDQLFEIPAADEGK